MQVVVDDSRSILYTLGNKSTLCGYQINKSNGLNHLFDYNYHSMVSHAQMVSAPTKLLAPQTTSLISISAMDTNFSKHIYVVAMTSTGCRLYLRGVRGYFSTSQNISSLQVSYVKLPPITSTVQDPSRSQGPGSVQFPNGTSGVGDAEGAVACVKRATSLGGHFFAFYGSENYNDKLFAATLDSGRVSLDMQSNQKAGLQELGCYVPIEGLVQDIVDISEKRAVANELSVQYQHKSDRRYAILTNSGVHIIRRRFPISVFYNAITSGANEHELAQNLFQFLGRAEACTICLAVACGRLESSVSSFSQITDTDIADIARKLYLDFGGKASLDEARYTTDKSNLIDKVKLSGRWEGLSNYISRILVPIWSCKITKVTEKDGRRQFELNFDISLLREISIDISGLRRFFQNNKSYIEGLSGPSNIVALGQNTNEEIISLAEFRGMSALMKLVDYADQALEFLVLLYDDGSTKFHTAVSEILGVDLQFWCLQVTFEQMITTKWGLDISKELVNSIVNHEIKTGGSIESITSLLRERCPLYCSKEDVLIYRAINLIKEAKEIKNNPTESKGRLTNSLELFELSAVALTKENISEIASEYNALQFPEGWFQVPYLPC